jgi:hypothetical protein
VVIEQHLLEFHPATVRSDPHLAIVPGNNVGTKFRISGDLSAGSPHPHPDNDDPCTLALPFIDPSNNYLPQACIVCTLLLVGYTVW